MVYLVEERLAGILLTANRHLLKRAVGIERYRCMKEQIVVANQIHTAIGVQATHMFLQLFAVDKRVMQLVDQFLFLFGQPIRVSRVDGRERLVEHIVGLTSVSKRAVFVVDLVE